MKNYTIQKKNYTMQMKNYTTQMKFIPCNWKVQYKWKIKVYK